MDSPKKFFNKIYKPPKLSFPMPNKFYRKGVKKEHKIVKNLKADGFDIAQRSAGSHSPIDIFAINKKDKKILFIQSKPDNYPKTRAETICKDLDYLNDEFKVEFILL